MRKHKSRDSKTQATNKSTIHKGVLLGEKTEQISSQATDKAKKKELNDNSPIDMQRMTQRPITLEDVLKYEEELVNAVEELIASDQNPNEKAILLKLQALLKVRAVKTFVDHINIKQFSLSSMKKVQEIDDALDQLRVMNLNLPYPQDYLLLQQGKAERAQRSTLMAILLGLFGFEWVE